MRLLFAGTPEVSVVALDALYASAHDVVGVLTRPPAKSGRGRSLRQSPVHRRALELAIPVFTPTKANDPEFLESMASLDIDCAPVVAYGALLPESVLRVFPYGWVNLHFSLLPRWRGAAPVQSAIWNGDEATGASTFQIEAGLDTGPVFASIVEPLSGDETSGELLARLAVSGAALLVGTMDAIDAGTAAPVEQSSDGVTLAPKLHAQDARIDWTLPADDVDRRIRACTPEPGAWTVWHDERVKVLDARIVASLDAHPSHVAVTKHSVTVATATDGIQLVTVQPHGKKPMAAADWARGARIVTGDRLG